jgi:hypothetical protein
MKKRTTQNTRKIGERKEKRTKQTHPCRKTNQK